MKKSKQPLFLNARDFGASGSEYQTTATTAEGSRQITVADAGDFQVGQGVVVSKSNVHYTPIQLWGTGERYRNTKPLDGSVEVRGYDRTSGSWLVYVLDIAPGPSPTFRWSDDLGRTWQAPLPVTNDWQALNGGIEVRLNRRDWEAGYVIAFGARDQLVTKIEKMEGNVLTLADAPNRTGSDAVVRHDDTGALQAAVDHALQEKLKLQLPAGRYRLAHGIRIKNPDSITIEGASAEDTVLDISDGEGCCLSLSDGTEAVIRNLGFVGFMGFDERDKAGELRTLGSTAIWGFILRPCHAMSIQNTRRVLVENCHASRMSGECFVSFGSRSRASLEAGTEGDLLNPATGGHPGGGGGNSEGITYLRCSVTDCARNAFNDTMCGSEFTTVQSCRIVDVGGCAWEGASRFVKITGNYIRNAGIIGIGNLGPANRDASYPALGAGQHIVADNVFENMTPYGGCAIRTSRGATQVIVRNNLFINFNTSAVETGGHCYNNEYPAANTTITGNIFDMTAIGQKPTPRTAITVAADDTIVSDNQIYVRGGADPLVTGIQLSEPAMNASVHDNLIRNCGTGILATAAQSSVGEIIDATTFQVGEGTVPLGLVSHQYRGWDLAWFRDGKPDGVSVIDSFEALTARFKLKQSRDINPGDQFEIVPPSSRWNIHDNTITDCLNPVVLDSQGSPTSVLTDNIISRTRAMGEKAAIHAVRGTFDLSSNRLDGFEMAPASPQERRLFP